MEDGTQERDCRLWVWGAKSRSCPLVWFGSLAAQTLRLQLEMMDLASREGGREGKGLIGTVVRIRHGKFRIGSAFKSAVG